MLVCRTRPEQPRLRINSEDIDTGPPNANHTKRKQSSSAATNNPNRPQLIAPIENATNEIVAAKSLASYCQYDSVDLDNLENIDITQTTSSQQHDGSNTRNSSKILDEFDLQYDTTAITSI